MLRGLAAAMEVSRRRQRFARWPHCTQTSHVRQTSSARLERNPAAQVALPWWRKAFARRAVDSSSRIQLPDKWSRERISALAFDDRR